MYENIKKRQLFQIVWPVFFLILFSWKTLTVINNVKKCVVNDLFVNFLFAGPADCTIKEQV